MQCIKLKIADIVIEMRSAFALEFKSAEEKKWLHAERYENFFYTGREKPHIVINVKVVDKLPQIKSAKEIFVTFHPEDNAENWRLFQKNGYYIYKTPIEGKRQVMVVNRAFDKVTAYLLPKKNKGWVWDVTDIIYDFLQVLLINYFALHRKGIFVHSVGVKDFDGGGLLFAGKSRSGKSTTAKIWHKHSTAMVLNDDRIIVRKFKNDFFIYGCPWHGDFSDYLSSRIERAMLKKIFFIHHSQKNTALQISPKFAFNLLYPVLFPTFWDKAYLENIALFSQNLIRNMPCYTLGFVNNKEIMQFVRKVG